MTRPTCLCGHALDRAPEEYTYQQFRCPECGRWNDWPADFETCLDSLDGPCRDPRPGLYRGLVLAGFLLLASCGGRAPEPTYGELLLREVRVSGAATDAECWEAEARLRERLGLTHFEEGFPCD